jgi:23S rRNA U2552 (ribose-2'-O)-methylase RlmE/FtsJ
MIAHRIPSDNSKTVEKAADKLKACREEINQAKELIGAEVSRAGVGAWDRATQWMELSRPLALALRGQHGIPKDASNAFFKAIELFNLVGPFLRSCGPTLKMFDNACLPGDFVRAAQWWADHRSAGTIKEVDWRANSLVGGLDDRFGLLRDHPDRWMTSVAKGVWVPNIWNKNVDELVHMTYGPGARPRELPEGAELRSIDGDVTCPANRADIRDHLVVQGWKADIYTSDLGFAVQSYFHEEEEHSNAHEGQVNLGLSLLREGGAMIVKTFTMSTVRTVGLISHLTDVFNEFYVVKPATSKRDNSECYWVCLGYLASERCRMNDRWYRNGSTFEVAYTPELVKVQQVLARRQAQKIKQNVVEFRARRKVPRDRFNVEIKRWSVQHIGVDIDARPSSPALTRVSESSPLPLQ